ncbi:MAG: NACHT domain-containing protein [Caldilineaceae bacterium]|nr:NACHT domain-containing protein [Caldilineaceae bacterium]
MFVTLVTSPQPQSRAFLADLLWNDVSEQKAKSNLRYTLRDLRKIVGEYLDVTAETVAFRHDLPHWVDATTFARYLASVSFMDAATTTTAVSDEALVLDEALELYAGEYLYGFALDNAPVFERQVAAKRRHLHDLFVQGLNLRIRLHQEHGEYEQGLALNQLLLTLEPWREEAHRQRMLLFAYSGQRNAALKQYTLCCQLLAEELDVPPMETTTALYERIRSGEWFAAHSAADAAGHTPAFVKSLSVDVRPSGTNGNHVAVPDAAPSQIGPQVDIGAMPDALVFCGREAELATLHDWIGRERARVVALLGISGVGKSALTAVLAEDIAEAEEGPGHDFTQIIWRTLQPAPTCNELLHDWLQQLGVDVPQTPAPSFDQLTAQLFAVLQERRCLLVLDGLDGIFAPPSPQEEWFEERYRPGLEPYEHLLRLFFQRRHRSCVVLNSRVRPKALSRLDERHGAFRCLELDGITAADTGELLTALGVITTDETRDVLHQTCNGSPLLLHHTAEIVLDFFAGDVQAFLAEDTFFVGEIGAALARQIDALPALERRIMQALAESDQPVSAQTLTAHLRPRPDRRTYFHALQNLRRICLVRQDDAELHLSGPFAGYLKERARSLGEEED